MIKREQIIEKAFELGFFDVGFTTAEPFNKQVDVLNSRKVEYAWAMKGFSGLDLLKGTDPRNEFRDAKSIIVLMHNYFYGAYPKTLERHFGRCYLDDDRVTKDGLSRKVKAFRGFLRDHGISSRFSANLPHRIAAARAGLGTFGRNCLFYSNKSSIAKSSWVLPLPIIVDVEFKADEPTFEIGCPDWCRNACIIACPTGALKGPRKLDPRRCISYLSYFGEGPTPREFREPMGLAIYGCDHCQNVCPRNKPWLGRDLPLNESANAKEHAFELSKILHMDRKYYRTKIWPHMFYMGLKDMWRWKMNAARAMGNTLDPKYIPDLTQAYNENKDNRVKCLIAWSLGKIGGNAVRLSLESFLEDSEGQVREEIIQALKLVENQS